MSNVPGINAKHKIVTPECRQNHGDYVALEIAVQALKDEYDRILGKRGDDGANYHFVLSVESEVKPEDLQPIQQKQPIQAGTIVHAGWLAYRATSVSLDAGEGQLSETRKAFYMACSFMFNALIGPENIDANDEEAMDKYIKEIQEELISFAEDLVENKGKPKPKVQYPH